MNALIIENGLSGTKIFSGSAVQKINRHVTLPGYYRPVKAWDQLVIHRGQLIAAFEFKSQVGPSFGNNFNNRCEEAIGTATDLWVAYREGAFGDAPRPFLGYLMLLEDCEQSRSPVKVSSKHFAIFREFEDASYSERYEILCRKLVQEKLYESAVLLLSQKDRGAKGDYVEASEVTGLRRFVAAFAAHIAAAAALS